MDERLIKDTYNFEMINYINSNFHDEMARDILIGLTAPQKFIPCKYFYDERGSRLFEEICHLPEYYPTRIEMKILRNSAKDMMMPFETGDLIELGSGTNWKIRMLLDTLSESRRRNIRYVPVDVSETALTKASLELQKLYPEISILAIVADFIHHIELLPKDRRRLLLFFGGTIGNLDYDTGAAFLKSVADIMNEEDRFLFGIDMLKPIEILHSAYNDSRGITSEFNRNILNVINRELNANFKPLDFEHVAFFNEDKEQVEMHLRASRKMVVEISNLNLIVQFEEGETINTEICRKFSRQSIEEMLSKAGLYITDWFSDPDGWFSIVCVKAS